MVRRRWGGGRDRGNDARRSGASPRACGHGNWVRLLENHEVGRRGDQGSDTRRGEGERTRGAQERRCQARRAGAGVVVLELGLAREADLCDSVCEGETRAVLARVTRRRPRNSGCERPTRRLDDMTAYERQEYYSDTCTCASASAGSPPDDLAPPPRTRPLPSASLFGPASPRALVPSRRPLPLLQLEPAAVPRALQTAHDLPVGRTRVRDAPPHAAREVGRVGAVPVVRARAGYLVRRGGRRGGRVVRAGERDAQADRVRAREGRAGGGRGRRGGGGGSGADGG